MGRSLNLVLVEGNLGRDPEMRYTPSGQAVTQMSVAASRNWKDRDDQWQEETTWFRVTVWGPQAERAAEYLRKGSFVRVQGRIRTFDWDVDGCPKEKHHGWEVVAFSVDSLDKREEGSGSYGHPGDAYVDQQTAARPAARDRAPRSVVTEDGSDLDDLPF